MHFQVCCSDAQRGSNGRVGLALWACVVGCLLPQWVDAAPRASSPTVGTCHDGSLPHGVELPHRTAVLQRLSAVREEPEVVIRVSDSGPGIAAADLTRVFQPFAQAAAGTAAPGAGLGLSLVKQFVELHGGRVRLDSAPKRGLSVSLFLPAFGPATDDTDA